MAQPRVQAAAYTVYPVGWEDSDEEWGGRHFTLRVEQRSPDKWVVFDGSRVYTEDGPEHESQPSSRTDEFIARTRMTLGEAVSLAKKITGLRKVNGLTFTEMKRRCTDAT